MTWLLNPQTLNCYNSELYKFHLFVRGPPMASIP